MLVRFICFPLYFIPFLFFFSLQISFWIRASDAISLIKKVRIFVKGVCLDCAKVVYFQCV